MGGRIVSIRDKFLVQLVRGQGYVVTDEHGKYLTGPSPFHSHVDRLRETMQREAQAKANAVAKVGVRPCMCCQKAFQSEGIHNRMCNGCRGISSALGDPVRPQIARRA